jgi:hypothetical protein
MASISDASSFSSAGSTLLGKGASTAISGFTSLCKSIQSIVSSMMSSSDVSSSKMSEDSSIASSNKQTLADTVENSLAPKTGKPRQTRPTQQPIQLGSIDDPLAEDQIAFLRKETEKARRGIEHGRGPQPTRPTTQTELCNVIPRRSQTGRKGVSTECIAEGLRRQIGR